MNTERLGLDGELSECLVHAKVLAIREESGVVQAAHVVEAAVQCRPGIARAVLENVEARPRSVGSADPASQQMLNATRLPATPTVGEIARAAQMRLRLAPDVAAAMTGWGSPGIEGGLRLGHVLTNLIATSGAVGEASLEALGLGQSPSRGEGSGTSFSTPYRSPAEYLEDQIPLWAKRRRASDIVRAKMQDKSIVPSWSDLEELAELEEERERRYWVTDPSVVHEPLGFADLPAPARAILGCLYMEELFDLDDGSFFQPTVRKFAMWLAPTRYPAGCDDVLAAARNLHKKKLVLASDPRPELTSNLGLSGESQSRLMEALRREPISEVEMEAFREWLRRPGSPRSG